MLAGTRDARASSTRSDAHAVVVTQDGSFAVEMLECPVSALVVDEEEEMSRKSLRALDSRRLRLTRYVGEAGVEGIEVSVLLLLVPLPLSRLFIVVLADGVCVVQKETETCTYVAAGKPPVFLVLEPGQHGHAGVDDRCRSVVVMLWLLLTSDVLMWCSVSVIEFSLGGAPGTVINSKRQ